MSVKEYFIDLLSYRNRKLCKFVCVTGNFSLILIGIISILKPISDICNNENFLGKHFCLTFITLISICCLIIVIDFIMTFILFFIIDRDVLFEK